MRRTVAAAAALAAVVATCAAGVASAASVPASIARPDAAVTTVQSRQYRPQRDCTPFNGPYGFYGNPWCQPPSEQSYMRNLGSRWNMETPPSLRYPKPRANNSDSDW